MKSINSIYILILITLFSLFYSFLHMNLLIMFVFLLSSSILIYKENKYLFFVINKYKYSIYMLFIYLILFSLLFITINNFASIFYFLTTIWSIFLTIICLKDENINYFYKSIKYLIYIYISSILIYLYCTYGKYPRGYELEYFANGSANGVTSFLNILLAIYTSLKIKLENKNTIIITLISFYICLEGYARGSIIFVFIILLVNLIFIYYNLKIKIKLLFILSTIILAIISFPFIVELYQNTKLASGFDSPRLLILNVYLEKIDLIGLFFGVSYENTIIENLYNNNPHISFIRAHNMFGLFYLLALMYLIISKIFYIIISKNFINLLILLIIFNILLRAVTEPILFPTLFDFLFLYILFLSSKKIIRS